MTSGDDLVQRAEAVGHRWSDVDFSPSARPLPLPSGPPPSGPPPSGPLPSSPRSTLGIQRFTDPDTGADVDVARLDKAEASHYLALYYAQRLPDITAREVTVLKRYIFQLSPQEIDEDLAAIRGISAPVAGPERGGPVAEPEDDLVGDLVADSATDHAEPAADPRHAALGDQVRSILNRGSAVSASGAVASTLHPDRHDAYVDALAGAMVKIVDKFFRSARRTARNPAEEISEYAKILEAALIMVKRALGLAGGAIREPTLVPQRAVPGSPDTAMQMLRYLITDSDEGLAIIDPVHATFGASKDAAPELACIDLAMSRLEHSGEMVDRLTLIDREWAASELRGEIRIQTAFARGEDLLAKHWKTLPKMIHESLHALTHPNFLFFCENYPTARGRDILTEGVTDLLKNYVLSQWTEEDMNQEPILSLVAGLQKTRRTTARKLSSPDYSSIAEAREIEALVTIDDVIAAYIGGHTERIGLTRDSIPST